MNTRLLVAMIDRSMAAIVLVALTACGGGSGGGSGSTPPLNPPIANVTGTWTITENISGNCPNQDSFDQYNVTVTQNGNNLTVVTPSGTFSGTISGSTVSWTGSYPLNGGTATITSMTLTVAANGNSLSGPASWTWSGVSVNCSGTTSVSGTRVGGPPSPPPAPGTINEQEPNNTFGQAQALTLPVTVAGNTVGSYSVVNGAITFAPGADPDFFRLTVPSTKSVTLALTGSAPDIDLYLLTTGGSVILSGTTTTSNETITANLVQGTYLVLGAPFSVTSNASYTLSVQ